MHYGVILSEKFVEHVNPVGHPERPERIHALISAMKSVNGKIRRFTPVSTSDENLKLVHSPSHVERVKSTSERSGVYLDSDTHAGPDSYEIAKLAVGSGIRLLELLMAGEIDTGFLLARPPGHHAESNRAMGFCLFNTIAVVSAWALDEGLARKVAIVDFDVHHGNGTQQIFFDSDRVLYTSSHQYPFYPGTGSMAEVGTGRGVGLTVNFPVTAGRGDGFFLPLYNSLVTPILREFSPELILISAGYDCHFRDPLGGMKMTSQGFGYLAALLQKVATEICAGKILYILEGGYDLQGLAESVIATVEAGIKISRPPEPAMDPGFPEYKDRALAILQHYWSQLT